MTPDNLATERHVTRATAYADPALAELADPVTTEVIRNGLNSGARQMASALVRTAFSTTVYERLDYAAALYDKHARLLAQSSGIPFFMGSIGPGIEATVAAVGGEEALEPGDILIDNLPFHTGAHPPDALVVLPVFLPDTGLIGYSAVKAHWRDFGGKDPYSTDTIDVFQEGMILPGVKLYRGGQVVEDIYKMIIANTRLPGLVGGDLNAEIVGVRTGEKAFLRVVEQYGYEAFLRATELMFNHGEALVRKHIEAIPDGRYTATGAMDDNGIDRDLVPFDVTVIIDGSTVTVDYTSSPDVQAGPINCPVADTVCASRVALMMLVGAGEGPTEGHFRPIEVVTRPNSVFHALHPAPTFLAGNLTAKGMEVIYGALSQAIPEHVPARSAGDWAAIVWWGRREDTGEFWSDGAVQPQGQGAHANGDGASALVHLCVSEMRNTPVEVYELRNPLVVEKSELAPDSGGPGKHRGGVGLNARYRMLEHCQLTVIVDSTKTPAWGLEGGWDARPNRLVLTRSDGSQEELNKLSGLRLEPGWTLELESGGGGGWGPPLERDREAVRVDLEEGFITEQSARDIYGFVPDSMAVDQS